MFSIANRKSRSTSLASSRERKNDRDTHSILLTFQPPPRQASKKKKRRLCQNKFPHLSVIIINVIVIVIVYHISNKYVNGLRSLVNHISHRWWYSHKLLSNSTQKKGRMQILFILIILETNCVVFRCLDTRPHQPRQRHLLPPPRRTTRT